MHRYVYYRVAREHLAPVLETVRGHQQRWQARCAGLLTELYVRDDDTERNGPATVMEVWRWDGGLESAPLAPPWSVIEGEVLAATRAWMAGDRHVERFVRA
ncbi:MAG: hypothetical protein RI988_1882 [Pseudomonadota bacterium]